MTMATISLLLKSNKDPTSPSSYCPLSLINTDMKIISKALASQIETVTPSLIHLDQTGFMKGRHSSHTVRCVMNLVTLSKYVVRVKT